MNTPQIDAYLQAHSLFSASLSIEQKAEFCYTEKISHTHTNTHMSIETCIAHAIHKDLDIVEALPEVQEIPMEQLELYVEQYVLEIQRTLCTAIEGSGDQYLRAQDAAGLCAACMDAGVTLPPRMLLKMCQTIIQLTIMDARFVLDTPDGASLYFVKMAV